MANKNYIKQYMEDNNLQIKDVFKVVSKYPHEDNCLYWFDERFCLRRNMGKGRGDDYASGIIYSDVLNGNYQIQKVDLSDMPTLLELEVKALKKEISKLSMLLDNRIKTCNLKNYYPVFVPPIYPGSPIVTKTSNTRNCQE